MLKILRFFMIMFAFLISIASMSFAKSAKENLENLSKSMTVGTDSVYVCDGGENKAVCKINKLGGESSYSLYEMRDLVLELTKDTKNFQLKFKSNFLSRQYKQLIPSKINCFANASLNGDTLEVKDSYCNISSNKYDLKLGLIYDYKSKDFAKKSLDEVIDMLFSSNNRSMDSDFIDLKIINIYAKGKDLFNALYAEMKKEDPNLTKESLSAQITAGTAAVPLLLYKESGFSQKTISDISKSVSVLSEVVLSKRDDATITMKKKPNTKPIALGSASDIKYTELLNQYDITVK